MGPGRLTGMNAVDIVETVAHSGDASMGPGRLTGMNATSPQGTPASPRRCFNGARSIDRDERSGLNRKPRSTEPLQWGPVD